ncbi:MAG: aspartate 1-decarboxylase [Actinobacteria bacterium]|nr:aspartate 1-decarboxylase [Actinomycetota bacterium]
MRRSLMKSKIHRATVTQANLDYVGSITIDAALMARADLIAHEKVQVVDVDNGARLETYVIPDRSGSGVVALNGPAARLVHPGDRVIVISYAQFDEAEAVSHRPTVVFVDDANRVTAVGPEVAGALA